MFLEQGGNECDAGEHFEKQFVKAETIMYHHTVSSLLINASIHKDLQKRGDENKQTTIDKQTKNTWAKNSFIETLYQFSATKGSNERLPANFTQNSRWLSTSFQKLSDDYCKIIK